ncbi:MAG TPA: universal stress protein [Thermoplasmata archaeon]|jgi:nucleotide-binding universal stress UspA family protein|nr:universal stress protein [Thermoplasmata archaeon]
MLPKRILVGFDGSKESEKALDTAVELAKAASGTLIVQHVVAIGPEAYEAGTIDLAAIEQDLGKMLDRAVERARHSGITATKVLSRGDIAATLLREAEQRGVELIVVGSLGRGRMARLLMGSVADKLVRLAPVSVLVVR